MKFDMVMPKMGESITEGTVIKWLKKVGETVEKDEIILEISTDKVDSEIPSPVAGKISDFLVNEGDTVEVGTIIAKIETEQEDSEQKEEIKETDDSEAKLDTKEDKPEKTEVSETPEKTEKSSEESTRFYSPVVLSIARNEKISSEELDKIPGTGINGRVTKNDVLGYLKDKGKKQPDEQTVSSSPEPVPEDESFEENRIVTEPMDHIRKKIADHMVKTVQTSPHVGLFTEVDMSNIYNLREKNKASFKKREGINLTYLPFISEMVVKALKEFPYVNSSIDGENILVKHFVNLGIAVATEQGLIVPVIKNADTLNLTGISRAINDLAIRARSKKLTPDDISGGTFSISNFGVYGTTIGFPLINQPQLAILGIGALKKRAVVINDAIAIRPMMNISISFDHRLIDGELGAKFLQRVAQLLTDYDPNTII